MPFLPAGSPVARRRYGAIPWLGGELILVDDRGRAWVGPPAFLTCLWATARYGAWAYRLNGRLLAPVATWFFIHVTSHRAAWSRWPGDDCTCDVMG